MTEETKFNLGNVVGIIRSAQPPKDKPYVIWGKIIDVNSPLVVKAHLYEGVGDPSLEENWRPIAVEDKFIDWGRLENVPVLAKGMRLTGNKLELIDLKNNVISSILTQDMFNSIPSFEPLDWYKGI